MLEPWDTPTFSIQGDKEKPGKEPEKEVPEDRKRNYSSVLSTQKAKWRKCSMVPNACWQVKEDED